MAYRYGIRNVYRPQQLSPNAYGWSSHRLQPGRRAHALMDRPTGITPEQFLQQFAYEWYQSGDPGASPTHPSSAVPLAVSMPARRHTDRCPGPHPAWLHPSCPVRGRDPMSKARLYFMYNPEIDHSGLRDLPRPGALDPFNTVYQSGNLVAPPSILDFSFELFFDRQEEATQTDHPGVFVDYQFFDMVVRNVVPSDPNQSSNTLPDNGVMMVNPRDITVVFSPQFTVQGRPLNAQGGLREVHPPHGAHPHAYLTDDACRVHRSDQGHDRVQGRGVPGRGRRSPSMRSSCGTRSGTWTSWSAHGRRPETHWRTTTSGWRREFPVSAADPRQRHRPGRTARLPATARLGQDGTGLGQGQRHRAPPATTTRVQPCQPARLGRLLGPDLPRPTRASAWPMRCDWEDNPGTGLMVQPSAVEQLEERHPSRSSGSGGGQLQYGDTPHAGVPGTSVSSTAYEGNQMWVFEAASSTADPQVGARNGQRVLDSGYFGVRPRPLGQDMAFNAVNNAPPVLQRGQYDDPGGFPLRRGRAASRRSSTTTTPGVTLCCRARTARCASSTPPPTRPTS